MTHVLMVVLATQVMEQDVVERALSNQPLLTAAAEDVRAAREARAAVSGAPPRK
jgi:hypothetical protein